MDLLMNGLLFAGTCFAGAYCWILARRVHTLKSLDSGLGGAIVTLTRQVELARTTLDEARSSSRDTRVELAQLVQRADTAAGHLRLLIAAVPAPSATVAPTPAPVAAPVAPAAPAPIAPAPAAAPTPAPALRSEPPLSAPRSRVAAVQPAPAAPSVLLEPHPFVPAIRPRAEAPAAQPAPQPAAPQLAEVPKPRALMPIENPLRRAKRAAAPDGEPTPPAGEDALLEALSALAGGR